MIDKLEVGAMFKEYIFNIGFEVVRNKVYEEKDIRLVKERIKEFVEAEFRINYHCTLEEEIDFQGVAEYLQSDLLEDIKMRLFGNLEERRMAHSTILSKAIDYAKAKTNLSRERTIKMTETTIEILRNFYKSKTNSELKFLAAQIEDTVIVAVTQEVSQNQEQLSKQIKNQSDRVIDELTTKITEESKMSIENNILLIEKGKYEQVEKNFQKYIDSIGTSHELYPNYTFALKNKNGVYQLFSKPLSDDAITKYPPKISFSGKIEMNGKIIKELNTDIIDYANRHQFPIAINIEAAHKFLGNILDPIQREAKELVGETLIIQPEPFPVAIPCKVELNDNTFFEFVLLRTQEILDDGTIVISNQEQSSCHIIMTIKSNLKNKTMVYNIKTVNPDNKSLLKYVRFIKHASTGAKMSIKVLETGEKLAEGYLSTIDYKCGFESIDAELEFLENIVAIENYYSKTIIIPKNILEEDCKAVSYLATLIQGGECEGKWTKFDFSSTLTKELKEKIIEMKDSKFSLTYCASVTVTIFEEPYELMATRVFDNVRICNLEKLKEKANVLETGDYIKVQYLPGDGESGIWKERIYEKVEN